ncbi:adhesion G-protein coupled receptor G6-like [Neocloeon triangulifer]|uniref:adhesion G-protein coupled receptor G6-like n=1 Tax=Neocloeon triangulifer TaxID=2078957 RepID=UPI00286F1519|nr:adhesion G-protein coupled receptor G6-like [Neocloeon triangulifer]
MRLPSVFILLLLANGFLCQNESEVVLNFKDGAFFTLILEVRARISFLDNFETEHLDCSFAESEDLSAIFHQVTIKRKKECVPDHFCNFELQKIGFNGYYVCRYHSPGNSDVEIISPFYTKPNFIQTLAIRFSLPVNIGKLRHECYLPGKKISVKQIARDKHVAHFSRNVTRKILTCESDFNLAKQLRISLESKCKQQIEFIRSTFCCFPEVDSGLPFGWKGESHDSLKIRNATCIGDYYAGARWNETKPEDLKYLKLEAFTTNIFVSENFPSDDSAIRKVANLFSAFGNNQEAILKNLSKPQETNLLKNLDHFLANVVLNQSSAEEIKPNFAVRVENINGTKIRGMQLTGLGKSEELQKFHSITSESNDSSILQPGLIAAVKLPESSLLHHRRLSVVIIQESEKLFLNEFKTSDVVNVNLDGKHLINLDEPVIIWFPRNSSQKLGECGFWNFSLNNGNGNWSTEGCKIIATHKLEDSTFVDECHCWHMTHYALIFWDSKYDFNTMEKTDKYTSRNTPLNSEIDDLFEVISNVGCITSLVCLAGVFLAATISSKWRKGVGQKLLLHMALSLTILYSLFLGIDFLIDDNSSDWVRFIAGFCIHYSILAHISWMLVAAYWQYKRLVKVMFVRTSNLILKSSIVGWCIPIIPGLIVLILQKFDFYSQPPFYLPTGLAFYLTVAFPVALIQFLNLSVFAMITYNLCRLNKFNGKKHHDNGSHVRRFIHLVYLFTMLGLVWIFGVLQIVFPDARFVFGFLFNLVGTSQGISYFVFFVLMHREFKNCCRRCFTCFQSSESKPESAFTTEISSMIVSNANEK